MHEAVPVPAVPVPVECMQAARVVVLFEQVEFTQVASTVAAPIAEPPCIVAALIAAAPMWAVALAPLPLAPLPLGPPPTVRPHIHTTTGSVDMPRIRPATKVGSIFRHRAAQIKAPLINSGACEAANIKHQVRKFRSHRIDWRPDGSAWVITGPRFLRCAVVTAHDALTISAVQ